MSGNLYIVATPIGNLDDITLRAINILKDVDYIISEDTRVAGKLFNHLNISTSKLVPYHQHSKDDVKYKILNMLVSGSSVALITDAGTPGVSDPGNELIDFVMSSWRENSRPIGSDNDFIKIFPIPGPSALTAAISVSGVVRQNIKFTLFIS